MTAVDRHRVGTHDDADLTIGSGTPIEVWCRSVERWVGGFELVDWAGDRCWIRRAGDTTEGVLPELFRAQDVRRFVAPAAGTIGRNLRRP